MKQATFRFYAELNDFLPAKATGSPVIYPFRGSPSIKDSIEAIGVPHPEVDLILINGRACDFEVQIETGDRISVYPAYRSLDLGPELGLQPESLEQPKFVADIHLGQLSRYLRMLGFDCRYRNDASDASLATVSSNQDRILLTRDRELLKRGQIRRGYYLRSNNPRPQLVEVARRYDLAQSIEPFRRCMACNGLLAPVDKAKVADQLPKQVRDEVDEFVRCRDCRRVYWRGSHVERMENLIEWLLERLGSS